MNDQAKSPAKAIVTDLSGVLIGSGQGGGPVWSNHELNGDLFEFYQKISKKIKIYIFTLLPFSDESKKRFNQICGGIFQDIFTAEEIGFGKSDPRAYEELAGKINLKPEEIIFIDDFSERVQAAKQIGMIGVVFENTDQTIEEIKVNL